MKENNADWCEKNCPYFPDCGGGICNFVLGLLKEQEPYSSTETDLNRDEYCRVGDVLDCFDGMDLEADEVFHAVNLIEWAMSKRSIPLQELLKEQEPVKPYSQGDDSFGCGNCGGVVGWDELACSGIESVKYKYCPECGRMVKWSET